MGFIFLDECPGHGLSFGCHCLICLINVIDAAPCFQCFLAFAGLRSFMLLERKVDIMFLLTKGGGRPHSAVFGPLGSILRNNSICTVPLAQDFYDACFLGFFYDL